MQNEKQIKEILEQKDKRIYELEKIVDSLSNDLADQFFQSVELLSSVISFTERNYEGNHSRFVSERSEALAKLLGINNPLRYQIKVAGLLHGLGKVSFKDSNLHKFPHEMTKAEYQQYTLYPVIGVEILKNHRSFQIISDIVLQHQERLDGSGFPKGMKGDDIHPGARIIAVVDTYHNLVYKKARESSKDKSTTYTNTQSLLNASKDRHSSALKYLEQKRGSLFDPRVVDAFIVMIDHERSDLSDKQILRVPVNKVLPGMIFAQDFHTSYGLLIASRGERVTEDMLKPLIRFAENEEIPHKLLMLA
jgi:HD-GYP domain-containing protein (c-di-GMP phosphodiesterase class II)